ncbi:HAMP domain-containing protein [Rhodoplanes azumiensis]|uniref:histidine kinase n=1 Tax=Rhodoplanes azumiensis TaxID=1897628 RepID=A0ABW5AIC7_9BRAD
MVPSVLASDLADGGTTKPDRTIASDIDDDGLRALLAALQAMRSGDFSVRMRGDHVGLAGKIADTFNEIAATNERMATELARVGDVVGRRGRTRHRVRFSPAIGAWADMETSVNDLIDDLLWPTKEVTRAVAAVAQGDLMKTVRLEVDGRPLEGEFLEAATIVNTMIKQLGVFTAEVTRVAREVGTEGKLGGQAQIREVSGVWKDLTDSVNSMAGNLTAQVRNIAEVTIAVANGDLSKKITVDVRGEILQLKEAINTMVDQLRSFASEVTRVAREVGTDGKLGGQALVPGVAGIWKDLTDSVNAMCGNLTDQVRNIAQVTTAVARGDLSRKITVDVRGEILELKDTINTMVDQLNGFASEVTRVAREVGTDGKLGGQATVPGVAGTWKDLTDSVNSMASNLTAQVRSIAEVATAVAKGDLSRKITVDVRGEILELKDTLNTMVDQLNGFASEVTRVAREVGTEGRLGGQANVPGVAGTWKDLTDNVNLLAANLTTQVRNIAEVTTAVARGDLSRKITVDVKGEILELKNTINTMVDQLNAFAAEVTRVAREVGTEGKLGGQAQVPGVAGTWKDLTDNVNFMASNLTAQVRNIAEVATAIAGGDLSKKITVDVRGEILLLKETLNTMVEQLRSFASEVTRVAHEVGVEGRLGGQAAVPGAAGTWKDLTGNVNLLAANLTNQVRAIAEVATAVTKGDLTRSIQVDARGEVAQLKDNINTMIDNLRLTTERNTEQDWLKTNLARFTAMLQGQRDLGTVGRLLLDELTPLVGAQQGVIYQMEMDAVPRLRLLSTYADSLDDGHKPILLPGEGLAGQCALDKRRQLVTDIPADSPPIVSSLFRATPRNIVVLPVLFENQVKAVIELASIESFKPLQITFLEQLTDSIGIVLNSIEATMQTEGLLQQSQQLAAELQAQQRELQQTNEQLEQKAAQLAERNVEVERKNQEIEQARRALEEQAAELALTSKYKSEFLANMSHELRTPLNSILILGQQLADNPDANLSARQVEFARTIHGAGTDLLNLISDILDLSKIESGTVTVEAEELLFSDLVEAVARPFRHEAETRSLAFSVDADARLGRSIVTDPKRLQQVLKNLLSNAFKFTERGSVRLTVGPATSGWTPTHPVLGRAASVVAFEVADTGIGIPSDKQKIVFEAFQQADASTSRRFGGTGLGLAISRELAALLGGEIQLHSTPGAGSTFVLYLPARYTGPSVPRPASEASPPRRPLPVVAAPVQTQDVETTRPESGPPPLPVRDDRHDITDGDAVLMIVEDDVHHAGLLADLAHRRGFKVVIAARGAEVPELVRRHRPAAISLDIHLPDMLGWSVLGRLKQDPLTRHIPVLVVSVDEERMDGLARGAFAVLSKAATAEQLAAALDRLQAFAAPRRKRLLIVDDDRATHTAVGELLGDDDIEIAAAETGHAALAALRDMPHDCVVLDLRLSDMTGFAVLEAMSVDPSLAEIPVVVYTGRALDAEEHARLRKAARGIVVKGVESPERLLDETALVLHREIARLNPERRRMLERLHQSDDRLVGRTVLVVDDDPRNIFALSSVLERRGMRVLTATTGREAIETIEATDDLALVLMDIMMPEMDGYETMATIRRDPRFGRLPIIALTAKAMKGDRERCLEAGASDYLAKPVNTEQLLSALRLWLHR